jgi:hypothetical protein
MFFKTTSNFNNHVNTVHPKEADAYRRSISMNSKPFLPDQQSLADAFKNKTKFKRSDSMQIAINNSIVGNLVIGCRLSIYLVENQSFRNHQLLTESKWVPCTGKWISESSLPEKKTKGKEKLKSLNGSLNSISVTIDIWSDRRMRGFMGLTIQKKQVHRWISVQTSQLLDICSDLIAQAWLVALCNAWSF